MGSWDSGPFDNDDASDFVGVISASIDPAVVAAVLEDALLAVTANGGYIEAPEMSRAAAAAAVVAIFAGSDAPLPTALSRSWFDSISLHLSNQLRVEAGRAFSRAFEAADNEWFELWADSGLVDEVRGRIAAYASALA